MSDVISSEEAAELIKAIALVRNLNQTFGGKQAVNFLYHRKLLPEPFALDFPVAVTKILLSFG